MSHVQFSAAAQSSGAIVVAGCNSLADSLAMSRWLWSELKEWPRAAWQCWIADASDCSSVRAARIKGPEDELEWQKVATNGIGPRHAVCQVIGGRCGLVVVATDSAAHAAIRGLAGLVSGLTCIAANDPIAAPLRNTFASYGAFAGI